MDEDIDDINKLDEVIAAEKNNLDFLDQLNICTSDEEENENATNLNKCNPHDKYSLNLNLIDSGKADLEINIDHIKAFINIQELEMILQCNDEKLKRLMILNRYKLIQLKSLEVYINSLHVKCMKEDVKADVGRHPTVISRALSVSYPYFRTLNNNTCPPNEDAITKTNNGEIWIDYMHRSTIWTNGDLIALKRGISMCYYKHQRNEWHNKLTVLKKKLNNCKTMKETRSFQHQIDIIEAKIKEREAFKKNSYPKLHSTTVDIDWHHISHEDLLGRHSARSCEAIWNLFLHPSLNRSSWSKDELIKLHQIAQKRSYENWELIANDLDTNRSGYICCLNYYTKVKIKTNANFFTLEEDNKLLELIDKHRIGDYIPWHLLQSNFHNRTKSQLYSRYMTRLVYDSKINKGNFSKLEDIILYCVCKTYGENFKLCRSVLKTRSEVQLRLRYKYYIARTDNVQNGYWSLDEDKILLEHIKQEGELCINKIMKELNRTATSIRHRLNSLTDWMNKNPGEGIGNMIRKKGLVKDTNQHLDEIRSLGDDFLSKDIDINIENVTTFLQGNDGKKRGRPHGTFKQTKLYGLNKDTALISYFKNVILTKSVRSRKINTSAVQINASMIRSYLSILNVKLNIPDDTKLKGILDLDDIDMMLLKRLRGEPNREHDNVKNLIPSSISSLVSLRHLLLNFMQYKTNISNSDRSISSKSLANYQRTLSEDETECYLRDCKTFANRLNTIYTWPSIMSLIKRTYDPVIANQIIKTNTNPENALPKKRGRPKKNLTKVHLMNKAKAECKKRNDDLSKGKTASSCIITNFTEIKTTFTKKPIHTYGNKKKANKVIKLEENIVASSSMSDDVPETLEKNTKENEDTNLTNIKRRATDLNEPIEKRCKFEYIDTEYEIKSEIEDIRLLEEALNDVD